MISLFYVVFWSILAASQLGISIAAKAISVEFDGRSFIVDGKRTLFIAGSVHYPRAPRNEWDSIFQLAKAEGINLIQTYVFWDVHEPENDKWNFPSDPNSSEDLVAFVQKAAEHGLFVHLRIAGYVCAEWTFGGLPVWLKDLNATLRTYDSTWLRELSQFVEKTLSVVKDANLLASQGGPIVMLQIENEYGNMESYYGAKGMEYVKWLSNYALSLDVGHVPWIMCQQGEGTGFAPAAAIINSCNGFYCDNWISKHAASFPNQPHMWTENWPGWFQNWGEPVPHRPAIDVAFAVARWFARGGSYLNYYMLYGGTTFGRSVGGPLIVTSYDYDVMLNEYALPAEPKYSLLQQLHSLLLLHQEVLLSQPVPEAIVLSSDEHCETHIYRTETACVAFYSNWGETTSCSFPSVDTSSSTTEVLVPAWSVSIATGPNCSTISFNTRSSVGKESRKLFTALSNNDGEFKLHDVHSMAEPVPSFTSSTSFTSSDWPKEQLGLTKDSTDFLWYSTSLPSTSSASASARTLSLAFSSGTTGGGLFYVYLNGQLAGSTFGTTSASLSPVNSFNSNKASARERKGEEKEEGRHPDYYPPIAISLHLNLPADYDMQATSNRLDILSASMGLKNYGPYLETITVGIMSNITAAYLDDQGVAVGAAVVLQGFNHTVGLQGEQQLIKGASKGESKVMSEPCSGTLCWFTASFNTPLSSSFSRSEKKALGYALNLGSALGKGQVWVNGHMLGRYWNITATATASQRNCQDDCSSAVYVGSYDGDKCRTGCGSPSQEFYKLPANWLKAAGEANELVILEELSSGDSSDYLDKLMLFEVQMSA